MFADLPLMPAAPDHGIDPAPPLPCHAIPDQKRKVDQYLMPRRHTRPSSLPPPLPPGGFPLLAVPTTWRVRPLALC
jgi:hypothetical protein